MEPVPDHTAQLASRTAELAALTRIAEAVATAPDLETFLDRASDEIGSLVGCDLCAFFLVHDDPRALELLHFRGGDEDARRLVAGTPLGSASVADAALDGLTTVRQASELAPSARDVLARLGLATIATVPVRFRSRVVAVITAGFRTARDPVACRTDLLLALGAHAAAAIETQRLLTALRERVSELTLLNDITVASTALDPVLLVDSSLRQIAATFRAEMGTAYLLEGVELVQVTAIGVSEETRRRTARLPTTSGLPGRALQERRPVHLPALDPSVPVQAWMRAREGIVAGVAVPLLVKDRGVGAFVLGRRHREPFSDAEVRLLWAIGVQLGIVVENARLFADTRRRAADLEAVNSLALQVFDTAPGDAQALLAATTRAIAQALSARSAVVLQLDATGTRLEGVTGFGTPLPPLAIPLAQSHLARQVLETRQPALGSHLFDVPAAGDGEPPPRSLLLVPLTSRRAIRGLVAIADAPQRKFSDAEIALALALASEAAMGLESAELYAEAQRRVAELSLVNEVGRTVAGSLELDRILAEGARAVHQLVGASGCHVLLIESGELRFAASTAGAEVPRDTRVSLDDASLVAVAARERRPVTADDALASSALETDLARTEGVRSLLAAPLLVRDEPVGVLVVAERDAGRRLTRAEIERVMAIANQLAVAIENARLYEDLRRSYADLARAQEQLVRQERLAALGELAAVVAHEVRNPLGVIFNSLGALRRHAQHGGDTRTLLDIADEEADRLNRIVGELLDFAKPSTPDLRPTSIARVIDDAVAAALAHEQRLVQVAREVPAGLPPVPMDAALIRQAIVNIAVNALQAMPDGGTLTVRARVAGDVAIMEIGDTGPGIPEQARGRIFEPFFTTKATGTGLGLALVKRILEDHHGRVAVQTSDSSGTVFAIHLPLTVPADRPGVEMRRRMGRG